MKSKRQHSRGDGTVRASCAGSLFCGCLCCLLRVQERYDSWTRPAIQRKRHAAVISSGNALKLCSGCTALINTTFAHRNCGTKPCKNVAELSESARKCQLCHFMLRNLPYTQGQLTFTAYPHNVPPCWSARVGKGPNVFFLPTQEDGSFLEQPGEDLVNKIWIRPKIHATGAKYEIALKWLNTCLKHEKCRSGSSQFKTPTRLIDVGLGMQNGKTTTQRLVVGIDGTVPYAALSYRWGGLQPLILTLEALPHFQHGMPWSDFPKLFQDSITICRAVGIQYLWIDALCIIQPESDGGRDWTVECTRMQDVYAGSTFTISATAGLNPNQGLFSWRPDQYIRVRPARVTEYKNVDSFCIARSAQDYQSNMSHFSNWAQHMNDLPISTRAWTLQERFLPPAVLHFYQGAACWECRTGLFEGEESTAIMTEDENRPETEGIKPEFDAQASVAAGPALKKQPSEGVSEDLKLLLPAHDTFKDRYDFGWWYRIVEMYQRRGVTRSEDRLPAIGGLAGHFAQKLEATYLAGLWEDDFRSGLLWQRAGEHFQTPDGERVGFNTKAPTWSWAHLNGPIGYAFSRGKVLDLSEGLGLRISYINVKALHGPFGEIEEGVIVGNGLVRKVERGKFVSNAQLDGRFVLRGLMGGEGGGKEFTCVFDDVSGWEESVAWLLLANVAWVEGSASVFFLVLKRISERHPRFERVGIAWCTWQVRRSWADWWSGLPWEQRTRVVVNEGLAGLVDGASEGVDWGGEGKGEGESRRLDGDGDGHRGGYGDGARGLDGTEERWRREDVIIV